MIEKMKGKCLPLKDLTAEQIEKVKELLRDKECFDYRFINVGSKYYLSYYGDDGIGVFGKQHDETPITFSKFLEIFEPFSPKRGDRVFVSDDKVSWVPRIFLTEIKGSEYPTVTVRLGDENKFTNNEFFSIFCHRFMKPYISQKLTKQEICEKFGIDDFEIV